MSNVVYHFKFADGRNLSLGVDDAPSCSEADLPNWTRMEVHQCENCPLSSTSHPRCPMAVRLVRFVDLMGTLHSYEEATVRVDTQERSVEKETTVQRAAGALMGLLSASSDCPRVGFLRPMAHFHLPFANEDETVYRTASTYLLAQYFLAQNGGEPDWTFEGLKSNYNELRKVNAAMAKRLRDAAQLDGVLNALVLLDLLAQALPYSIDERLGQLASIFGSTRLDLTD